MKEGQATKEIEIWINLESTTCKENCFVFEVKAVLNIEYSGNDIHVLAMTFLTYFKFAIITCI